MTKLRNHDGDGDIDHGGDGEIARIATAQNGVISIDQLEAAGVTKRAAAHRAGLKRLHRVHRGVYSVGHLAIGERGRHIAAVLACGPGSAVSHLSAAALWGLRNSTPAVIDVIVPCQTGRKIDGIRARRCRYPSADELTVHEDVPCTTPSRTLVDLAGTLGRVSLRRAVEEAAVLGLLDLASLDRAVARAKGRRGVPALRAILTSWRSADDRPLRLRSGLEAWLMSAAVGSGLPRPQCNVELQIDGERLEIDLLWERQRLAVETDGETTHGTGVAFHRDRRRDQILAAAGYRTARVTWRHMEDEPTEVLDRIRHMLEREPVES